MESLHPSVREDLEEIPQNKDEQTNNIMPSAQQPRGWNVTSV